MIAVPSRVLRHDHPAQPVLQIVQVPRQAEHRHHLGGDGDVEAILAREAVGHAAQAAHDGSQRAVVHVEAAPPRHAPRIDAERIAPVDVVVDHRGEQVVGGGDGVEVAGEVQVDLVHRHHLGVAAAGRAALHAEAGAQRRFAQADHRPRADAVQRIAESHRRRRLALARWRRADAGHQHQCAIGLAFERLDEAGANLRLVATVWLERVVGDVQLGSDLRDRTELGFAGDLQVAFHVSWFPQPILRITVCDRLVVCGRILGAQSPISAALTQAGLSITSAASTSYSAR